MKQFHYTEEYKLSCHIKNLLISNGFYHNELDTMNKEWYFEIKTIDYYRLIQPVHVVTCNFPEEKIFMHILTLMV